MKKKRYLKSIIYLMLLLSVMVSSLPLTVKDAYAEPEESWEQEAGISEYFGNGSLTTIPVYSDAHPVDHVTMEELSALGCGNGSCSGTAEGMTQNLVDEGYSIPLCGTQSKSEKCTLKANKDGTYTLTWNFELPALPHYFYYTKANKGKFFLCAGVKGDKKNDVYQRAGNTYYPSDERIPDGTWDTTIHHHHYFYGTVTPTPKNAGTGSCKPRKYNFYDRDDDAHHDVHTTLRRTGNVHRNVFELSKGTVNVTAKDNDTTKRTNLEYTYTFDKEKYKDLLKWCKTNDITKGSSGYKLTLAVSQVAQPTGAVTSAGCSWHGVIFKTHAGGAGNGISQCNPGETGFSTIGKKIVNPGFNKTNSDGSTNYIWIQDNLECNVSAYSKSVYFPDTEGTYQATLTDYIKEFGEADYNPADDTVYSVKSDLTAGTTVSADVTWKNELKTHNGFQCVKQSPAVTISNADVELARYFEPASYTATCVNIFRKKGTEITRTTEAATKTVVHGQSISGSAWGTASPNAAYDYANCTTEKCNAANVTVYRYFDLGTAKIVYHSNYGTDTTAFVEVFPGDAHTIQGADKFTRTAVYGAGNWELAGWSDAKGADNAVNYNFGTSQTFALSKGGVKDLYAVWRPSLKVEFDVGARSIKINGETIDNSNSETPKYFTYRTAVKADALEIRGNYHFKDADLDGQPLAGFAESLLSGTPALSMTDCHTLEIHTDMGAQKPVKHVYKHGTKTDVNGCVVNAGDKLDYEIRITNLTSVPRDVIITDVIDEGLTYEAGSADNGGTYAGGTLTWNISQIAEGESKTVRYTVTVNEKKKGQMVENTAVSLEKAIEALGEVTDLEERSNKVTNYVMEDAIKHLRKTAASEETIDETIIKPEEKGVYTILIKNPANVANTFTVKDVIPKGLTIKEVSDGGSFTGQTVTWTGISIAGGGGTKTLAVEIEAGDTMQGETIVNTASVTCIDAMESTADSNEVENYIMKAPQKSVYTTLNEDGSINMDKENIDEQIINDGVLLTYKIDWQNPTAKKRTMLIKDVVPEGTRIATAADLDKAMQGIDLSEEYGYTGGGSFLITDGGVYDEATKTITWEFEASEAANGVKDNGYVEFSVVVLKTAQDKYIENKAAMTVVSPTGINENNPTMDSNTVRNPVIKTPHKIAERDGQDVTDLVVNDGEQITYRITVKNPADRKKNFTVTDIVPEFTELINDKISDGGTYDESENLITWKLSLEAEEEKTVSFTVAVKEEGQNQTVKNTARVYADKADVMTDKDTPTKIYILEDPKKAVMNIDGEDISGIVKRANDIITYHIIYKNPAEDEKVATITDKLPDGVAFVSATNQGSYDVKTGSFVQTQEACSYNYDPQTNTITWTTPTAGGCQENVSVDVRILDSAKDTILKNTATVHIPDATKKTNEVTTPVADNPVKEASDEKGQDLDGNIVTVGEEITYTLSIKNPADEEKEGFITDKLPEGVDFVSASDKGAYDTNSHAVFWKNIMLKPHEQYTVTLKVKVNDKAASTTIDNEAVFRIDEASVSTKVEDGGKGGPKSFVSVKEALDKKGRDINKKVVAAGNTILYKISYKNITDQERFFTIYDEIPQGEEIVDIGGSGFIVKAPIDGFNDREVTANTVAWQFYVPAGEEGFVTVTTKVTATKECMLRNNATIQITEAETDAEPFVKETNTVVNPVITNPVKMVFDDNGREITDKMVATGDLLTYQITYINPADEVKYADIIDTLPDEVKFVSCDYNGVYDEASHMVKWKEIETGAHERTTVSVVVKVKESAGAKTIANKGALSMDEAVISARAKTAGSDPEDPEPSDKTTVENYVACKKSYDANGNDITDEVVKVGDTMTYRIYYKNTSSIEKEYTIKDTLPQEVDFVSATGNPSVDGRTLTWSLSQKAGSEGYVEVSVTINEEAYGKKISNQATITELDPNDPNNPYTITTTTCKNYPLDEDDFVKSVRDKAGKDADGGVVAAGSNLYYHIKLHNPAESKKEFTVSDTLPDDVKYVSSTEGGRYDKDAHTVSWKLMLEKDATADLEICVKVKNSVTSANISNMAHLVTKGTEADTNEVSTFVIEAPVKTQSAGSVELKDNDKVGCMQTVVYTISFENPFDEEMEIAVSDILDENIKDKVLEISDGGKLQNGTIVWHVSADADSASQVSFTVSAPESNGVTVSNVATVTYDGLKGEKSYQSNKVTFVTEDNRPAPGTTPEIVKTGDEVVTLLDR